MKKRSTVFAAALMFLGAQAQCQTAYMYIDNGGGDVHQTYSMLSVVDTTAGKQLADLKIEGETLEAMALEKEKLIPPRF